MGRIVGTYFGIPVDLTNGLASVNASNLSDAQAAIDNGNTTPPKAYMDIQGKDMGGGVVKIKLSITHIDDASAGAQNLHWNSYQNNIDNGGETWSGIVQEWEKEQISVTKNVTHAFYKDVTPDTAWEGFVAYTEAQNSHDDDGNVYYFEIYNGIGIKYSDIPSAK